MVAARLTFAAMVALLTTRAYPAERSAGFAVTVQVVSSMAVQSPSAATVAPRTALLRAGSAAAGEPPYVARVSPVASVGRTGGAGTLVGPAGEVARPCVAGSCEAGFSAASVAAGAAALVVTFLPDGAPTAIVER
jgi:hypothetical protein